MASANQYPPVAPPPPPYRYRRSIAGPLILIIIGGLFLARNLGWRFPIWRWFGHWWPVLLIVWGVIVLIERLSADRSGYRRRGIGAGGVLLLIFLVSLGVIAHETSNFNWSGVRDQMEMDDDMGGFFGTPYTFENTVEQPFPAHGTLRVVSDRGAVNISPSDDNTIHVVVHKKLYASSQKDADTYNDGSKPLLTVTGDSVVLNANTNGSGDHNVQSDMDIQVPAGAAVDIAGKRGDVTVNDRKAEVKIALQHGDVAASGIAGPLSIALEKGSIRANEITGDVDITGHVDDVTLDDVAGAVHLNGDFYEDVRLSKIAKTVIFKTSRSDMQIASVPGEIEIASDQVRGSQLDGPSRVMTSSKDIHLEDVSGDLQVQSNSGDVEVTTAGKQPAAKMSVTTQHGDVALTLAGKAAPEKVNVASQHGDVTLTLSPTAGFQVSAATRKGDISSDFSSVKIDQNNGASQASGTVGNGSSKLQVTTDTGDIKIVKS
ncbi:MAG TPA: DUF4097 family beta strand repeat-containing protein [Candidatus Bathyarchaeia archaeon]|nr:DUF4097 family beta strand repeat-containing protein [Candidatus Bathyarchaeia archaeon]